MLRFRLHQLYLPSLGRFFLPLPKLTEGQVRLLSGHLERRGFSVRLGSGPSKRVALKGTQRIAIDGPLGVAGSGADMLDALAPAIPDLLTSPREGAGKPVAGRACRYYSLRQSGAPAKLQLFPRLESLRTWTCLRKDGMCGLTPDEAAVLRRLLGKAPRSSQVDCVTAGPRQGSVPLQLGRKVYYRSTIPVAEFLESLRTVDSDGAYSGCYLPRDSVISLPNLRVGTRIGEEEFGEWCYLG